MLLCAVACSPENPVVEEENDDDRTPTEKPVEPEVEEEKEDVVMIYGMKILEEDGDRRQYDFKYDGSGRLIEMTDYDEEVLAQYVYSTNEITINAPFIYGETRISLDKNGLAAKVVIPEDGYTAKFSYDMTGYISGVRVSLEGDQDKTYTMVNENGNFTEIPSVYDDITVLAEYTQYADKYSIPLSGLMVLGEYDDMISAFFPLLRIKGAQSANLMKKYQYEDEMWEFSYVFDDSGNVESMTMSLTNDDGDTFEMVAYFDYGNDYPESMPDDKEDKLFSVSEALKVPDNASISVEGNVVGLTQRGFLVSDDIGNMLYVYGGKEWECSISVGDYVIAEGTMSTFWNNREMILTNVERVKAGVIPDIEPYELTESNLNRFALASNSPMPVKAVGVVRYGAPYCNIVLGNSPIALSVEFPLDDMSVYDDKEVEMSGYYLWTSTPDDNQIYVDVLLTDISVLNVGSGNAKLVKSLTTDYYWEEGGNHVVTFEYDSKDRITDVKWEWKENDDDYIGLERYHFEYDDALKQILISSYDEDEYEEDGAMYFDSSWYLNEYVESWRTTTYMYSDYKVSKEYVQYANGSHTNTYVWKNGNIYSYDGSPDDETQWEYYAAKNKCNVDFYNFSEGGAWIGVFHIFDRNVFGAFMSDYLVKKAGDSEYAYEIDDEGYPTKVTIRDNGELYEEMTIEYYD